MKLYIHLCSLLFICAFVYTSRLTQRNVYKLPPYLKLQMINIVFRHGDRVPLYEHGETYPNDPHIYKSYYPISYGGLTNKGKLRAFSLGHFLRLRYGKFLGKNYLPEDVTARSTDVERSKMTLLLVLAALYPPQNTLQDWHRTLNWQPIPIKYEKMNEDFLLMPTGCPKFKKIVSEIQELPEVKNMTEQFKPLWANLSELTGKSISNSKDAFLLYNTLTSQKSMSLPIPKEIDGLLNDETFLKSAALNALIKNYNEKLKKLNAGRLLKKMTNDMIAKQKRKVEEGKKINLYSAHDFNVAAHLLALGALEEAPLPHYASAVILELYRDKPKNIYYVQVLYYKGDSTDVEILPIKNCSQNNIHHMCEFKEYQELMKNVTPNDNELECCENGSENCRLQW